MDISGINNNLSSFLNTSAQETEKTNDFETLLNEAIEKKNQEGLKKACKDFEGYYIQRIFSEMRKTIPESNLVEKSQGREVYEDMLYEEYSKSISQGRGMGLADMLYKQLSKNI